MFTTKCPYCKSANVKKNGSVKVPNFTGVIPAGSNSMERSDDYPQRPSGKSIWKASKPSQR